MAAARCSSARLTGVLALVCAAAGLGVAGAQPDGFDPSGGDPALVKISSHLLRARALAAAGRSAAQISRSVPGVRLRDGLARVEIRLEPDPHPGLSAELRARGLRLDGFHPEHGRVYGGLDPADLEEIAALPAVSTIHPMPRPFTRIGAATSQADDTTRAVNVRVYLNYDGSEVAVGILSDSFNAGRGGTVSGGDCTCGEPGATCATVVNGMAGQMSGDLPPNIPILDDCNAGAPRCSGPLDEGAAMGELMFDLVPGASFLFHSGFNSPADFAGGITELANCGAEVIVDDVGWTGQAFFQDDVIAQAAQAAVDAGVVYVSAAGDAATFGIDDVYLDADADDNACPAEKLLPDGEDLHDFGGGDRFAAITVPAGCELYVELQWSEPFSGTLGPGAASDLDLLLLASPVPPASVGGANLLDTSITDQGCGIPAASGGDPLEAVSYANDSADPKTVYLAVEHCCGDEGVELRVVSVGLDCATTGAGWEFEDGGFGETPIFVDAQIFGHPAAADVMAVAAAFYGEIDSGGALQLPTGQIDVEPFSSLGGDLPFYFDASGSALASAPILRLKPELSAPDGTNNTFLGDDITADADTDPNLYGTSAAAAHAAALAALILDATGENITPVALSQILQQTALEMESAGPDALSGAGSADALRAVRSLDDRSPPLAAHLDIDLDGGSFLKTPSSSLQPLLALTTLAVGDGYYGGVAGRAASIIFTDGFESGDTSSWSNSFP